jgi:ribosomal protein S18 acetylase RimI-like enzyme
VDATADGQDAPSWRIPFVLAGNAPRRRRPDPPGISWRSADNDEELVGLVARALEVSVDRRDQAWVRAHGSEAVAVAMMKDARSGHGYEGDPQWWSIIERDGEAAGFVVPVVFTGAARDGRDEATIYHIGVVPEQRGQGLGALLLARGTDALLGHGVWRIIADTAAENRAMIGIFEEQEWVRGAPVPTEDHPLPGLTPLSRPLSADETEEGT